MGEVGGGNIAENKIITPNEFWSPYEIVVSNIKDLHDAISHIENKNKDSNKTFGWRGQSNSNWSLNSKLYRDLSTPSDPPTEAKISDYEKKCLVELKRWGLHFQKNAGRMPVFQQLAMLQHFQTATRLIDFSYNALVASFFAVAEDKKEDRNDSRIFAIDITDRTINDINNLRSWEDSLDTPWSKSALISYYDEWIGQNPNKQISRDQFIKNWMNEWNTNYYAWRPPSLDARISAQVGGFIFGGVVSNTVSKGYIETKNNDGTTISPKENSRFQISKEAEDIVDDSKKPREYIPLDNLRKITSIAIRPRSKDLALQKGRTSHAYSIRIQADAKKPIREYLKKVYGYEYATVYPDYPGFSRYYQLSLK